MTTLRKGLSSEDLMTEPNQTTIDNMQEVMVKKAQELFRVCDKEEKGFINKKDMQRLREELPVSPDQLEVVFDSLDEDGNGFLTLEEFTDGFGSFLGLAPKSANVSRDLDDMGPEFLGDEARDDESADEEMLFKDMIRNAGASNVFQDEDVIKAMWKKLYREDQDMSGVFEDFLARMSDDIRKSKVDFKSLESALVSKSNEHEEEVRKLYEEMELQIKQERERILLEEKQKEKHLKTEMDQQLMEKEKQLLEISTKHQEMEERLRDLNMAETSTKQENERLQKEKDRLEELLSRSQGDLEESRSYIAQIQDQQKDEKRERASSCNDLLEETKRDQMLRNEPQHGVSESNLGGRLKVKVKSRRYHHHHQHQQYNRLLLPYNWRSHSSLHSDLSDLSDHYDPYDPIDYNYLHPGYIPPMGLHQKPRRPYGRYDGMVTTKQAIQLSEGIAIERESLVKQLDILKDVNKKLRDDKDEAEATEARRVVQTEDDGQGAVGTKRAGRKELQKQGSVLSKYFPTSGPPRHSSGSMDVDVSPMLMECEIDDEIDEDVDDDVLKNANVFVPGSGSAFHPGSNSLTTDQFDSSVSNQALSSSPDLSSHRSNQFSSSQGHQQDRNEAVFESFGHSGSMRASSNSKQDHVITTDMGSTRSRPIGADAQNEDADIYVPKPSRVFKVVIIGDSSVGKSTFIHRFCHHEFKGNFNATIGVDFQIKTMECNGSTVILQLWDTAGQERFRSMTKTYFRKADGVIIMYDVTSEKTFTGVREWMLSVQEQVEPGTVLTLLGNKQDQSPDDGHRPVKHKDGMCLAVHNEAIFFETSAKSGYNVIESMEEMAKWLQEKEDKKLEEGLHLTEDKGAGKKKCCG